MKSSRRRARELALQGLYQWQLAGHAAADIAAQLAQSQSYGKADTEFFVSLLDGVIAHAAGLEAAITPCLDRKFALLSPVERAVLLIAAYELAYLPDTPYKVIINEAVELARSFGGTDGHKYVNGVLDRLAQQLRAGEAIPRAASG
jgi:transcription antitermination protein NusB